MTKEQYLFSKEMQHALTVAMRLIESFVIAAKAGDVAEISIGAFKDIRIIEDVLQKSAGELV